MKCAVLIHPAHERRARPCGKPSSGEFGGKQRCKAHASAWRELARVAEERTRK